MMSSPRFETVVFDLDGTLIDTIPLILESHRHAVREVLGRDLPDEVLLAGIGRPLLDQMRELDPDRAEQLLESYRAWNHANTERLLRPFAGISELLLDLDAAGVALGVVTSKSRVAVDLAFQIIPPAVTFDAVVTMEDTERHKPRPDPILAALERMGRTPATAAYVGDAPWDLIAARAAGVAAVAVTWGAATRARLEQEEPDAVADTPAELRELLLPVREVAGR